MELVLITLVGIVLFMIAKSFMKFEVEIVHLNQESLEVEAQLIIALLAKVAGADGKVCELEEELIKLSLDDFSKSFTNKEEMHAQLVKVFNDESKHKDNTIELAQNLYSLTKRSYTKRLKILEYLIAMAFVDREFSSSEEDTLITIAENLDIAQDDFVSYLNTFKNIYAKYAEHENQNLDRAYSILGADKSDDLETIKKKYRALVKENHPDIISGRGLGEEEVKKATTLLQEINSAYELIKKQR
ncbi:MAG: TerB family tellurite resistance protein [Epsilonproteobacteria bacterium]|nr:TerB family tellurite resistance protein [Campylobacterota bacterium]